MSPQPPTPPVLEQLRLLAGEARRVLNYEQAIQLNRQRADGWHQRGEQHQEVAALTELAYDYQSNDQPLVAFATLHKAQELLPGEPAVLIALGDLYTKLRLLEQAVALYRSAGPLAESRLMRAYLVRGEQTLAQECRERSRQRLRAQGNLRGEAILLTAWGDIPAYSEAVLLLEKAIAASTFPHETAQMLGLKASLLGLLKRPDEARETFAQERALCEQAGLWQERFASLGACASFEYFSGSKERAQALLTEFQALARERQSPRDEHVALQKRLDFASDEKRWLTMAMLCTELIALCLAHGWRNELPYVQERHAEALQQLGKLPEARAACRAAIAILEQQRRTYAGLDSATQAFAQGSRSVYERLLALLPTQSTEAFRLVQKLKARSLREQLVAGRIATETSLAPDEKALRTHCEQLNAALIREGIANEVGSKQRFLATQAQLRDAESALARFYDTLHARSPQTALRHAAAEPSLAQVQAQLNPTELLLDFILPTLPGESVRVLAIQRKSAQLIALHTPLQEIHGLVTRLRHACSHPDRPWLEAAQAAREALLTPLMPLLREATHVTLCPDGVLWEVPFGVLLAQKTLSYAFSAALWHTQRTLPAPPARPLALLAVAAPNLTGWSRPIIAPERPIIAPERPIIAPERPIIAPERSAFLPASRGVPLPGTTREVRTLAQLFPGTRVLESGQAQEDAVKAEAVRCRWLHIAAHAFLNDAAPELSCLVLSDPSDPGHDDGFLTARELLGLDLSGVELATLSACNTARGQLLTGEGVRGLSWALTAAGARNLVLSQWSVADASTAEWMEAFYTALKAGQSKSASLQHAAQQQRTRPERAHPYYWAAFILIGQGR